MKHSPYDMRSWELQRATNSVEFLETLRKSHKFLFGNTHWDICWEYGNYLITKRILKLPFNEVLFEYVEGDAKSRRRLTFIAYNAKSNEDILVIPFARHDNSSWTGGPDYCLILDQTKQPQPKWDANYLYETTNDLLFRNQHLILSDIFTATLGLLNMKDSEKTLVEVPDKLHKARKGKPPLYEYRFVELTTKNYEREYRGGTHASPALHWRRGHYRHLANNKIVPVAPCIVGTIESGIVEKSYDGRSLTNKQQLRIK